MNVRRPREAENIKPGEPTLINAHAHLANAKSNCPSTASTVQRSPAKRRGPATACGFRVRVTRNSHARLCC